MSYVESVPLGLWKWLVADFCEAGGPLRYAPRRNDDGEVVAESPESVPRFELRKLDLEKAGFSGAASLQTFKSFYAGGNDHVVVRVYTTVEEALDAELGQKYLVRIGSGPHSTGMWASGSGEHVAETVSMDSGISEASLLLTKPIYRNMVAFKALVLLKAVALSKGVVGDTYWEVERSPKGDFREGM